ncbi:hypothetical protein Tco_1576377 [Tanacetum coccineum]
MNEPELVKKLSKNDQLRLDEELAFRLQAEEEEEEERLAREKAQQIEEANTAWDDIQAKVEVDYQLAQRLHDEEQEQYTDKEKAKFFCEFLDQIRKFFAAKRAKAKRNKPPTQAQQRNLAFKRVNTFVDHEKELIEESSKKDEKVEAEIDDAKEAEELKQCLEIVPDDGDDVIVDATPLSVKMPIMLKNFDREDLEVLWRIVKARFKKTEPVNYMDTFLHLNLKTMFEHHLEDNVWKNQQGLVKVLNWKLYDSCGVHCVTMQNILYYLLVEKMYPLTKHTLHQMFNDVKLQVDYECEMAFELLRLVKKQLKEGYGRIVRIRSLLEVTAIKGQREVLDSMAHDFSRFTTWTVTSLAQLMDRAGVPYTLYSELPVEYQRCTKQRTDGASTSTAPQQPDP